ncbi:hypothetical protein PCC7424_0140 [Gloeothece citriformis PCC 7424]|uniref:XRE family transcriptional regulator n=1 Tax=Gloeothece citriformis (strain PCC 7424) TaxID=65393 RepID=B7K9C7_GLOC7|nr:hypothetical protein [Gloeothece citriformis]ACK68610.1 hypothetical protein PCC7424_0140 [Gloeothece citriformis PCC 7424]
MTDNKPTLSRGKKKKVQSVLDKLLEEWDMDYGSFSDYMGFHRNGLWKYRIGEREFRLNMSQIQKLEKLLHKIGKSFSDLPIDWYLDKDIEEEQCN